MNIRITIQGQSVVVGLKGMSDKPKEDGQYVILQYSAVGIEKVRANQFDTITLEQVYYIGDQDVLQLHTGEKFAYDQIAQGKYTIGWIESPTVTLEE